MRGVIFGTEKLVSFIYGVLSNIFVDRVRRSCIAENVGIFKNSFLGNGLKAIKKK